MNQIINMIIRQVTRQLISRGINAGFDKMGQMNAQRRTLDLPPDALDENGNPVEPQISREERRQQKLARQQAKRAKQSMKAMRKITRF
ncbi:hypothetical protein AB2B41_03745 [Marimonas sp. MJW-29]|uniref:Uncharacterized protein n=1 Tax=Sulfitobacter sediminis TaxID=3234186 RepID=A0ABV3RIJ7_9RHOB